VRTRFCGLAAALASVAAMLGTAPAALADSTPVVPAGVSVGGVDVSGLTRDAAVARVRSAFFGTALKLDVDGTAFVPGAWRFGLTADVGGAVDQALARTSPGQVGVAVHYKIRLVRAFAAKVVTRTMRAPRDAYWRWIKHRPKAVRQHDGLTVSARAVVHAIQGQLRWPATRTTGTALHRAVVHATVSLRKLGPAIVISRDGHWLRLYGIRKNGRTKLVRTFGVATGQPSFPTPTGHWHVVEKQKNPWWFPPDSPWAQGLKPIPPGPGNPLGTRWMGLDAAGVGMHGTPDAASIGYSASHGCIRMRIPDAEWLFDRVRIGTPVFIISA
jgi:lipoprotein-anchoring transpeptidase ErfK/SrfK